MSVTIVKASQFDIGPSYWHYRSCSYGRLQSAVCDSTINFMYPEYLQMELIDLQCNNELKHIFETSESKIDFYNVTKEKYSNLRDLAQKVAIALGSGVKENINAPLQSQVLAPSWSVQRTAKP
ncbi:hypothetical protein TNCV_1336101 [Trichonephila clavipes]|nr:hypothetical protein TNCV_1336101 [Trichonephila clavipes]